MMLRLILGFHDRGGQLQRGQRQGAVIAHEDAV